MRSSIHLTGRPPALRESRQAMSVPRVPPRPPKLPPWGWLFTFTLLEGSPKVAARPSPKWVADWMLPRTVRSRLIGSHSQMAPKVSMGFAPTRFQRNFSVKTCAASAKAWSTSPHVKTRCIITLVPFSSITRGLPSSIALKGSATASSGS